MSEADHSTLTADIKQHGQRDAITISDGMVLDGWHRYQSCLAIGLEPLFVTLSGGNDPVAFVKSHNLRRRHLTGSQRAEAVTVCGEWAAVGRAENNCKPGSQLIVAAGFYMAILSAQATNRHDQLWRFK